MAKQKIIQLKKIEEEKLMNETKLRHEEQVISYNFIKYLESSVRN